MSPLVSIVVPSYNHGLFIQECIQSIIDQDYENIELIIIDDGSSDDSVQKIEEMAEVCQNRFVRFEFRHRPNKGLCATLNEALEWSEGEFFSAIASDDILYPNKTSTQVDILKGSSSEIAGTFAGLACIDSQKKMLSTKGVNSIYGFKQLFLRNALITTPTLMLFTKYLKDVGGYDENIKIEDLDLLLRLAYNGFSFKNIKEPLVYYRQHEANLSSQHSIMLEAIIKIMAKYKDQPLYKKALSKNLMVEAHSVQVSDKKKSRHILQQAIKIYPKNILSLSMVKYILKYIIK